MSEPNAVRKPKGALRARSSPRCFVCGAANPRGLHIQFQADGADAVSAQWTPSPEWEGFQGIVHGGVVGTVLDEAMSKAVMGAHYEALTAELRVRYRKPVGCGRPLTVRGWVREKNKRRIATEATLVGSDGAELAHAWAAFLELRGDGKE